MIETVLVPVDFTIEKEDLLGCIGEFKNAGLKKVILLHVVDIHKSQGLAPMFERNAKKRIEDYTGFAEELGLETEALVVVGDIKRTISETADRKNVDAIIMGATAKGFIKGRFLGRTTEHIARSSKKILLVEKYDALKEGKEFYKNACRTTFSRVLVPLDFSKESMKAIEQLQEFGGIVKEVLLLHVIDNIKDMDLLDEQREEAKGKLGRIKEQLTGIKSQYLVVEGIPSDEIVKFANIEEATMIMLTSRGKGDLIDLILGSTAESVLRKTIKPVLIIPASKEFDGEEWDEGEEYA
ncbi:universal stress protein [Methanosarcina mazei]|uniref:Universal stress protein n=1 Tax=Methanosarcina mazei TaxID=2209 RepID=A0A0F8JRJ0_METMZ|nr:universal stress protein [Methanosarcina mazei]KKG00385.1 universal stress protein [Methanosarcina mazei]KKG06696.1 universal stress protein [Methanosarcina mazei]KKG89272.1 universal stress protein [Methanosarcina mazei]KKG94164.1 universal stress protein [Methanosarcina mazei]KKH07029.1 universal stress protein [Methanosarcina mazei]